MEGGLIQSPQRSLGHCGLLLSISLFFIPLVISSHLPSHRCHPGLDTPGVTYPRGDIILEAGSSLEILCMLNVTHEDARHRNSSHLMFFRNDEMVPKEFLQVVNATTLRLFVKEMPASSNMYYCRLKSMNGTKSVCLNTVTVGYKPQEVQNFTCISDNWQNLTCSWVPPHNFIKTTYTLGFRLPGRAGRRESGDLELEILDNSENMMWIPHGCPSKLDIQENRCFWNSSTIPHYRQPYEYYFFTINGRNVLGNMTAMSIKFHHYAHIIPAEPMYLRIVNQTLRSILLKWEVPYPLTNFPPGLIQKIEYQHQWMPRDLWLVANTTNLKMQNSSYMYNLSIEYSHTLYDIRVYMRSAYAIGEGWWSKPASITHSTMSTIPGAPPKVDMGSFEVDGGGPSRDVYIYWQEIPDYMQNGPEFQYAIKEIRQNGQLNALVPNEVTRAYAKFKGLTLNNYTFTVVSKNREGLSIESSQVYVPSWDDIPDEPASFTKIAFGDGIYELSWKHPNDQDDIVNYTIFWCSNERDRPYQCSGYLNWTYVSSDTRIINITVPEDKIYQFAISANRKSASSGMVWASCTVLHNKAVGKMKSVWKADQGSTFITLGWKLECSDRIGLVEGYRIYYCPIIGPYDRSCKEPEQNTTILSNDSQEVKLGKATDLKPYTTYMVSVSILTKSGEGLQSDPLLVTTLEEAPDSPPTNVTIYNVTNSSMEVSWVPPMSLNGILRYFEVRYNNISEKVEHKSSVLLEGLKSYYDYEVRVAACTVSCSNFSDPVIVRTAVGVPGIMERPSVSFINTSLVHVIWQPPDYPAGNTNYYELRVNQSEGDLEPKYYSIRHASEAHVSVPDCEVEGSIVSSFSVRAINVGPGNVVYRGPWSKPMESNCYRSGPPKELQVWIPLAFGILVLLLGVVYVCRRLYAHFVEISKIEVQIPDSLKNSVKDKTLPPDDHDRSLKKMGIGGSADEEKLLNGPEGHGRNPSGGSSGRGSAHESVSSERTSGTQISSDSGADVDRYAPSPDMFRTLPSNTPSSLRFRSQSLQSDLTESDHETRSTREFPPDGSSSPSPSSYLRIGLTDSSSKLPPPGGYVTLESMANPGTSFDAPELSCLDDVNPVSSGDYVAHPYLWVPKEASLLIPVRTTESAEPTEEVNDFVEAPDSYCRVGWQPGVGNMPESPESRLFPGRPSISVAEPLRPTASEGYVTVASLAGGGLPTIAESVRCHSLRESPTPDCGIDSGDGVECGTVVESQPNRMASPGYVALGYFAKDEGIHSANRDVMESLGGSSSGETTYHALANEES
ncbi:cytokine receptor-like isoform X2 [Ischnura elegans]|uniref:cytokine receptor-like isoform X2 n=1 Tax=Ischnura elegans TaxID=197161 RepID=UPI001ED86EAE|nr:cytokine receptor-like isoform X2 [Ischnura elegans]